MMKLKTMGLIILFLMSMVSCRSGSDEIERLKDKLDEQKSIAREFEVQNTILTVEINDLKDNIEKLEENQSNALMTLEEQHVADIKELEQSLSESEDLLNDEKSKTSSVLKELEIKNNVISKLNSYINDSVRDETSTLANLKLGDDLETVYSLYGKELYSEYFSDDDLKHYFTYLFYDDLKITLSENKVTNILVKDKKYVSNLGIIVGDNALATLEYCDTILKNFGTEGNLGWYKTKDNYLVVLYISEDDFRFNTNVENDSVIQGIELLTGAELD